MTTSLLNAARNLPSDAVRGELAAVQNSVAHLRRTNCELAELIVEQQKQPVAEQDAEELKLFSDTIEENEGVILRKFDNAMIFIRVLRERGEPATKMEEELIEDITRSTESNNTTTTTDNNEDTEGIFL
ncbi:hypothetical protein BDF19DRAFT_412454 [Syncephalis fuscata]|nr:hypothetical protein BDF19DRAFT_412454 [Syncephalis fuscata]